MFFKTKARRVKFFSYYKPYMNVVILDLICATLYTLITLSIPLVLRYITNTLLENPLPDTTMRILQVGGILIVLLITKIFLFLYTDIKGHAVGAMMEADMRQELFEHYQKLSFSFYDEHKSGELTSRIFQDTFDLGEFFHHAPEDIILYIVRFIGAFVILSFVNLQLMLIAILFLPLMAVIAFFGAKRLSKINKSTRQIIGEVNATVEDSLSGIRAIQSYTNETNEINQFQMGNNRFLNSRIKWYTNEAGIYGTLDFLVQMITIVVIVFGAVLIMQDGLTIQDLLTFTLYISFLTEPLTRIMWMFSQYQGAYTSFHRFMDIIETTPEITDSPTARTLTQVTGKISFQNVSFSYQDNSETNTIIEGLNLEIKANDYIAIVGVSGAGKTTLCSLIPRFYDVKSGALLIDDLDVRDITLQSLRQHIGVVSQDTYLFSGTIYENILFGNPTANEEAIKQAATKAGIAEFIETLPNGYQTDIGQRGIKLSGGQKQRISIARAFLKNPPILIFDEATSALDYKNEQIVQQSLEELAKNRTTLVIAHRLSTIKNANRIIVLENKKIIEDGTHDELLKNQSVYASLYKQYQ